MRMMKLGMMKLGLLAAVSLVLGSSSAFAITVTKRTEAPGLPPKIWAIAGDFCSIKDWHPLIADCKEEKDGDATVRVLTLKAGGTIKEKLTDSDDTSYSYEIVESPLPVKNYKAKLWVEPDDEADRTVIHWDADFDANGKTDDEAKKTITDIFAAGLKGIKKIAIEQNGGDNGGQ